MQGSTPLDVAAASVIDNNELALALQEQDLEKVWREEAWPLPHPLGHLLIWDPLCGVNYGWSRTSQRGIICWERTGPSHSFMMLSANP